MEQVYVIFRIDEYLGPDVPLERKITIKKALFDGEAAKAETDRLNKEEGGNGSTYFLQMTKLDKIDMSKLNWTLLEAMKKPDKLGEKFSTKMEENTRKTLEQLANNANDSRLRNYVHNLTNEELRGFLHLGFSEYHLFKTLTGSLETDVIPLAGVKPKGFFSDGPHQVFSPKR